MRCTFKHLLYPKDIDDVDVDSYVIAVYQLIPPSYEIYDGELFTEFKAVGYGLPTTKKIEYELKGNWSKDKKYGIQFNVESFEEYIAPTRSGIIGYLSSGQVKGVGKTLAERIYEMFGENTLEVLDKEPDKLLSIQGISEKKLKKIQESYLANRGARDVITFLAQYGISARKAVRIYKEYDTNAVNVLKNNPYTLCKLSGVGFKTADNIATSMGLNPLSANRIYEALQYTLKEAENKGNLCVDEHYLIENCISLLNTESLSKDLLKSKISELISYGTLEVYDNKIYRALVACVETSLAKNIASKIHPSHLFDHIDLDIMIKNEELALGLKFASEQKEAIKMALTNELSIITGGPGTGKTLIQRAILNIYNKIYPHRKICCCAPTGKAARRMYQSTGFESSTIHKALNLFTDDDGNLSKPVDILAGLVLVDEVSMLDVYIANNLFGSILEGTQVILVGDADQLPSVGPGAVLSEMIACKKIPVVKLDKVFRQDSDSRIAHNAEAIRHGRTNLDFGEDFQFIESSDLKESAEIMTKLYEEEVEKHGIDDVILLSPLRQKTETGVIFLNKNIQEKINPRSELYEVSTSKNIYRINDKVMQIKNLGLINNGDTGIVEDIYYVEDDPVVMIDFGDGRDVYYETEDLNIIDLGYACTIHKSQGSEYKTVIISLQNAHYIMLTRPLIYTAITRGKNKVIIVGDKKALVTAITKLDTEKRGTNLASKIVRFVYQ